MAPGNVIPRMKRATMTTYGKRAVKYTTCNMLPVDFSVLSIYSDKLNFDIPKIYIIYLAF